MTQAEQSLVERWVVHRDADAFARIVAEHSAMVYSTCLRLLRSAADAEDVAQECFLALASGRTRVRVSLGAWLHTLATRRSLDRIRSTRRREERERRSAEFSPQAQAMAWNDVQEYVDEAIAGLPAKYQSVLVAHFLEGQSFEALAGKLALPRSTVASRVQRAIELVRADLRKRGVPVQPSVLAAVLAAPVGHELPRGLALALGKMAIAGAGTAPAAAVAGGVAVLTGGTILMAKKVVALSIVGLALTLAGFFYGRQGVGNRSIAGTDAVVDSQQAGVPGASTTEAGAGKNREAAGGGASAKAGGSGSSKRQASEPLTDDALAAVGGAEKGKDGAAGSGPDRSASISGYVMDDKGYVFPGAAVRAEIYDRISGLGRGDVIGASTDSNGLYRISAKSSGYASVYASAKGYLMQNRMALPVSPGADLTGINFTLVPGKFFVAGTVRDQDGRELEGAEIQLRREEDVNAIYTLAYALSDKDGRFEIAVEREGSCDFSVSKDGYGTGFFPDIHTGTEDAEFILRAPGAISGSVTLPDGAPVPGARIEIVGEALPMGESPSEGGQPMQLAPLTVFSDEQGQYRADALGEGYHYLVQLKQAGGETANTMDSNAPSIFQAIERIMGSASLAQQRWVKVTAGETTSGIDFVLQPLARIHGTVSDTQSGLPAYHLLLEAYVGETTGLNAAAWTWTQPDGSYTLDVPLAAPASIRVAATYISSVGLSWSVGDVPLATVEGSPGADIEVNLTLDAPCSANITVTDAAGEPVAGAVLRLKDASGHGSSGGLEGTDENGRYALHGLPPNRLFIVAVASSAYGEAFMTLAESSPFYGGLGDAVPEVPIILAAEGGVEGVVVDPSGAPLPDLPIEVSATGNLPVPQQTTTTDADGWFTLIRGFPAGPYSEIAIRSSARGFIEQGIAGGAEVTAGAVVNVGTVTLLPAPQNPQAPPRE